jgi:hypothetical protein
MTVGEDLQTVDGLAGADATLVSSIVRAAGRHERCGRRDSAGGRFRTGNSATRAHGRGVARRIAMLNSE